MIIISKKNLIRKILSNRILPSDMIPELSEKEKAFNDGIENVAKSFGWKGWMKGWMF